MRIRNLISFAILSLNEGYLEAQKIEIEVKIAKRAFEQIAKILEQEENRQKEAKVEKKFNSHIRDWNHQIKMVMMSGWKPEATRPPVTPRPRLRRPAWRRIRSFCVRKGYY